MRRGCDWAGEWRHKWLKEPVLGAARRAQDGTSGTRAGTVLRTVPGVVARVTRKVTRSMISAAILDAEWAVILRRIPLAVSGPISRPAAG